MCVLKQDCKRKREPRALTREALQSPLIPSPLEKTSTHIDNFLLGERLALGKCGRPQPHEALHSSAEPMNLTQPA